MVFSKYSSIDLSPLSLPFDGQADIRALLLTVDTNVLGHRQSTEKVKGTRGNAEPGIRMGPNETYPAYHDAKLNWEDVGWLKDLAGDVPIYLKGVCHIDVSRLSYRYLEGNHG